MKPSVSREISDVISCPRCSITGGFTAALTTKQIMLIVAGLGLRLGLYVRFRARVKIRVNVRFRARVKIRVIC